MDTGYNAGTWMFIVLKVVLSVGIIAGAWILRQYMRRHLSSELNERSLQPHRPEQSEPLNPFTIGK